MHHAVATLAALALFWHGLGSHHDPHAHNAMRRAFVMPTTVARMV